MRYDLAKGGVFLTEPIVVLGAGSWGTAIARLLAQKGFEVWLWVRRRELAEKLQNTRENSEYLPGVFLPENVNVFTCFSDLPVSKPLIVIAVPSFAVREIVKRFLEEASQIVEPMAFVNLAKGLEKDSLKTMSEVIREVTCSKRVFTLTGPSHAEEVGRDFPTAVVLAGEDLEMGQRLQNVFLTERFRVYLSDDLKGVEYAATVKNIIAIAAGISDGLGYGDNSKGALIARGLAEMVRMAAVIGARKETIFGLAGLGDLVATCTSRHSRNRLVGERIGKGEKLEEILSSMKMVAEGVFAAKTMHQLAQNHGIEMPITAAVYEILYENASPLHKLDELMNRQPKMETL
ncbi:MAG: glycerol-3-phosphate dehydrogenase [Thermotogota bacterium]|nr:glycerol-3-phosphate dehydrogenase [Thermotogota bacterium]